jgi:hypothetical protein
MFGKTFTAPIGFCLILLSVLPPQVRAGEPEPIQPGEMAGYLLIPASKVDESYNAGFSLYSAAWPLLKQYPGHRFQTGLCGTWMHAQFDGPAPPNLYSDIEGGLGWWRDTRFPTETPKFIMGGVAPNFSEIANGPAHGAGDWKKPRGLYGVAQLSPWLLFPIDGLNVKQGTCGDLFGYGYLPLPLIPAKSTTAGKNVPTGDNCWTLFLNTGNFKGPEAFFTPYFWSHSAAVDPHLAGLLLDSRPSAANKPFQMETQYVPSVQAVDARGETYARIAATAFPRNADGGSIVLHRLTVYNKRALWDSVKNWFDGGPAASGTIDPLGASVQTFPGHGGATWKIYTPDVAKEKRVPLAWNSLATPIAPDPFSFGYRWSKELAGASDAQPGALANLPEYFHLVNDKKPRWEAVRANDVPAETGLVDFKFDPPHENPQDPYVTPEDANSCWKKPGPVAGPFRVRLGDGSTVTYYWYRFADQPAILNADLTDQEREALQVRIEKLHRAWKKDGEYLAPPTVGKLADVDPALIVSPPAGMEAGYVPIATRQGIEE